VIAATLCSIGCSGDDLRPFNREGSGAVINKETHAFHASDLEYTNDVGQVVKIEGWRRESGERRIYFTITEFNGLTTRQVELARAAESRRQRSLGIDFASWMMPPTGWLPLVRSSKSFFGMQAIIP
jgi:hypothetical protein